jgi:hypothetical protein
MKLFALALALAAAGVAQVPDIYTEEARGVPPFLWQKGWPLLNGRNLDGWHTLGSRPHEWTTARPATWKRILDPKQLTFSPAPGDRIVNGKEGRTLYLPTDEIFSDCELYLE